MKIYGVALLAFCFLMGKLIGNYLGILIGLKSDVGGVGFAMLFLMLSYTYFKKKDLVKEMTAQGILFWSSMYLPIIIAMAATQNVKAAISQGPIAGVIGVVVTITGFLLVPLISKIGQSKNKN
ncbi:MAG: malonate transporter subunit MadL [Flavobacteriaceae bacterium]|nr:malonate transporter subunit MadL [Flavobacteriaceae bacterium]|tara:strand:+ start:1482 stop:1850 length:369 start_codon:yes stop_codon:yes gene_type:complete